MDDDYSSYPSYIRFMSSNRRNGGHSSSGSHYKYKPEKPKKTKPEKPKEFNPDTGERINPAWLWILPILAFFWILFLISFLSFLGGQVHLPDPRMYSPNDNTPLGNAVALAIFELFSTLVIGAIYVFLLGGISYIIIYPLRLCYIALGKKLLQEERLIDPTEKLSNRIKVWFAMIIYGLEVVGFFVGFFAGRFILPVPGFLSKIPILNFLYGGLFAVVAFFVGSLLLGYISILKVKKLGVSEKDAISIVV